MIFPARIFEEETLDEKSKFTKFEHLSEIFTYLALIASVFLTILPYQYKFDLQSLYVATFVILIFSVFWFRFLPKKYSGRTKNLVFYAISIVFVGVVVYFTGGVQSPLVFLYYLTCLAVAASMRLKETAIFTLVVSLAIFSEAFLRLESLSFIQSSSVAVLHIWGLVSTVSFGYFIFSAEKRVRDELKAAHIEKAKEINRIKDEYVFIVSSKLAGPVVTLREYVKFAMAGKAGTFSKEQIEILKKTEENSRQLELLVGDLMDLSKIESGSLRLNIEKVDLGQILGSTLSDFSVKANEKNISIMFGNQEERVYVKADSARLHEVIANLVDNAIKYSSPNSKIKVRFLRKDGFALVEVKDQGRGISEEGQKHLFEKFYRTPETKDKIEGSGLGLFVSKQLIERQGGKIWAESHLW